MQASRPTPDPVRDLADGRDAPPRPVLA